MSLIIENGQSLSFFATVARLACLSVCCQSPATGFNNPGRKITGPFVFKCDIDLLNHVIRETDIAGCCSAGPVFR